MEFSAARTQPPVQYRMAFHKTVTERVQDLNSAADDLKDFILR